MAAIQQLFLWRPSSTASPGDSLIREDDGYVLREDDGYILLEAAPAVDVLIREDDGYVVREDDGYILLEGIAGPPPPPGDAILDMLGETVTDVESGDIITGL